jgi:hypothetical protein
MESEHFIPTEEMKNVNKKILNEIFENKGLKLKVFPLNGKPSQNDFMFSFFQR